MPITSMCPTIISPIITLFALVLHPGDSSSTKKPIRVNKSIATGIHIKQRLKSLPNTHRLSNAQHSTNTSIYILYSISQYLLLYLPISILLFQMYEIIKLIGRGANGDVFLCRNTQDNSTQAIKRLRMRDISQRERETIQTQLRLLKQFKHVNIVPFRDSFIDGEGNLNIVMGYCEGGDIHNLIQEAEGKKFQEKRIIEWVVQIALSIFYLHERRILHRDIKTQNIFLANGKVMLGDFGVSKVLDQAADLAKTNIGTPYYMSPQQYRQKPYSYKSDIWAFGCIIYEMCNHKHVFEALNLNALAVKVMKGIYAPVSQEYSRQLRTLVDEMLNQNPKNRPSIIEILTRPFLLGKVQNYMKKIYSQKEKYQPQIIQSLIDQAKSLGFSLEQAKPKKNQKAQSTPKKSKSQARLQKSKQKLKQQRQKKYEQLRQKLQKEIQQRNRAQQQLKNISKKTNVNNQKKKVNDKYSFQKVKSKKEQGVTDRSSRTKIKLEDVCSTEVVTERSEKPSEEGFGKNFKIEQDYDMDYEEYSDKDDNQFNKIFEEDEDEAEQKKQVKSQLVDEQLKRKYQSTPTPKQEPKKIVEAPVVKPTPITKPEDVVVKLDKLQKEVKQKTINITNIRNQMSKLDFVISSDSEDGAKQQKPYNPAHTRISQKINDLKQKILTIVGRDIYPQLLNNMLNHAGKLTREKVVKMMGEQNIGLWHIIDNIIKLDRVLKKIPVYCQ